MTDKMIDNLLNYDPVGDAEDQYGELGHDNDVGFAYALDMLHSKSALIKKAMQERGDTYDRMTPEQYLKVANDLGFNTVIREDFIDRYGKENQFLVLWHPDGMILKLDTFAWHDGEKTINSAKLYYNIDLKPDYDFSALSSGHRYWNGPITSDDRNLTSIWVGDHDVREALAYRIEGLRSQGIFLKEWVESDHVYLIHYMDPFELEKDWNKRSGLLQISIKERFAKLPNEIGSMLLKAYRNDNGEMNSVDHLLGSS